MQVLLNTDPHVAGRRAMSDYLTSVVTEALGHYGERLTRVEAHVSDANSAARKGTDDLAPAYPDTAYSQCSAG